MTRFAVDIMNRQSSEVLSKGLSYIVDGFIFLGTNFRGLSKNYTFVGFKIHGNSIFLYNSYRKSLFHGH